MSDLAMEDRTSSDTDHFSMLAGLGIPSGEIERAAQVLRDLTTRAHYPVPDPILALLPADVSPRIVEAEQASMNGSRHLWGPAQQRRLNARADFFMLAATVMDMRSFRGDRMALACANAMRRHAAFLTAFEGTRSPYSHD